MKNLNHSSDAHENASSTEIESSENSLFFTCCLLTLVAGLTALTLLVSGNRLAVLNVFFLPVILSGFYLKKQQTNLVALVSTVTVVLTTSLRLSESSMILTPGAIGFSVILWAAALGLTALLVGSLSTKHIQTIEALHEARVSVIELLNQYLHGANPQLYRDSKRIADLAVDVATRLRLSDSSIDSIRVACLLHDMEQVEITARAVGPGIPSQPLRNDQHAEQITFLGSELADSLGRAMKDVYPLLVRQRSFGSLSPITTPTPLSADFERAASIVAAVRAFDTIAHDSYLDRIDAIDTLAADLETRLPRPVIQALRESILEVPNRLSWKRLVGLSAAARISGSPGVEPTSESTHLSRDLESEIHAQL